MKRQIIINFTNPLAAIQAQRDQCQRISQQRALAGTEARLVLEKARVKMASSKARWQKAQQRYAQLEIRLQTLQAELWDTGDSLSKINHISINGR